MSDIVVNPVHFQRANITALHLQVKKWSNDIVPDVEHAVVGCLNSRLVEKRGFAQDGFAIFRVEIDVDGAHVFFGVFAEERDGLLHIDILTHRGVLWTSTANTRVSGFPGSFAVAPLTITSGTPAAYSLNQAR